MPAYRGIQKRVIVDSLREAEDFLWHLHLGSATRANLAGWRNAGCTSRIESARTDEELAQVMARVRADRFFTRYVDVLTFHAMTDPPRFNGQPNQAFDAFKGLMAWGAFSSSDEVMVTAVEEEIDQHLLQAYINRISTEATEPGGAADLALQQVAAYWREEEDDENMASWIEQNTMALISLHRMNCWPAIKTILAENEDAAEIIAGVIYDITDLREHENKLDVPCAVGEYLIVLGDLNDGEILSDPKIPLMEEKFRTILKTYIDSGDLNPEIELAIDVVKKNEDASSEEYVERVAFIIQGTKAAAQACANAFPGHLVENEKGDAVPPQQKFPQWPPRGPAP